MTLQNLKDNIKKQKELIREITYFNDYLINKLSKDISIRYIEQDLINKTVSSLTNQLIIINNATPEILGGITLIQKLPPIKTQDQKNNLKVISEEKIKNLVKIGYKSHKNNVETITLKKDDKQKFVKEVHISSELIKRLRERSTKKNFGGGWNIQQPSLYAKISNYFFRNISRKLLEKGNFEELNLNLRKSNSSFIINTYISIMIFSHILILLLSIIGFYFLGQTGFFGSGLTAVIKGIGAVIGVQLATFLIIYFSPTLDVSSMSNKINQELPFVTVHMSAIAGSGIEPSRIFTIIAVNDDYPNTRKELIKVINQVNYYGYDLVNALRNVAKTTSSEKLSELFKGLAVTISSGGNLESFLDKRAESLLIDYRLDREKYAKTAESFMNIYIALVITAPMIFLLLLILIGISGTGLNYTPFQLSIMIISAVVLINIIFLFVLNAKQPTY